MNQELLYLEERITALSRRLDDSIETARRAVDKAEASMNVRLDHMNQFRQQILSERSEFVKREAWALRRPIL